MAHTHAFWLSRLARAAAMTLLTLAAPPLLAHQIAHKSIVLVHPWVPPAPDPSQPVELRVKIRNSGKLADRLVGGATQQAATVEIIPAVALAKPAIDLPAGSDTVIGSDGGPRLVLRGLKSPLAAYDVFSLTLQFAKAGPVTFDVLVDE